MRGDDRIVKKKEQHPTHHRGILKKTIFIIGGITVLSVLVGIGTHQVKGESMVPTFEEGDKIFIFKLGEPCRGDIVTFTPSDQPDTSYIKRVIGMPGDGVILRGETLYLIPREKEVPDVSPSTWIPDNLPEGTQQITVKTNVAQSMANYSKVPENSYFVEGDNRDNSTDSRNFGWVSTEQIEGIVWYRYYPFSKLGTVN